jgi:hypothetical protein
LLTVVRRSSISTIGRTFYAHFGYHFFDSDPAHALQNTTQIAMLTEVNGAANTLGNLAGGCIECYDQAATGTYAL